MNSFKVSIDAQKSFITCISGVFFQPFLYSESGIPWFEANSFLFHCATQKLPGYQNSEAVRRKASILLEYRVFCDKQNYKNVVGEIKKSSIFDFSSLRITSRPTYRYFLYLRDEKVISRKQINMRTKVIYDFYNYLVTILGFPIEMERVSKTTIGYFKYESSTGFGYNSFLKRDQAIYNSSSINPVPKGFVRDNGEDIRPLNNNELKCMLTMLMSNDFDILIKLAIDIALSTGARKQTIFTLRKKHVDYMHSQIDDNNTIVRLKVGPGTGIDTKNSKHHVLFVPTSLVKALKTYISSTRYKIRVKLYYDIGGGVENGEEYIFLSRNGSPLYMAKDDKNYRYSKTKPTGTITKKWTDKIVLRSNGTIPSSFSFHWLRATFAKEMFKYLVENNESREKKLSDGDIITSIQSRMNHSNRTTTENYLKLFTDKDVNSNVQSLYESYLFNKDGVS